MTFTETGDDHWYVLHTDERVKYPRIYTAGFSVIDARQVRVPGTPLSRNPHKRKTFVGGVRRW